MSEVSFSFDSDAFAASLSGIRERVGQGLKAASVYLLSESARTIRSGGTGWPGFKRLPSRPHQLLYDTGRLIGSLSPGGAANLMDVQDDGMTIQVGSNLAYARAQNLGDPAHSLPARPFMFLDSDRSHQMASIIQRYINEG